MKKIIINILKKNQFLRSLLRKLVYIKKSMIYKKYCKKNNVDEKTIIFESFMGRSYSDNPRALYEEMIKNKRFDDYKFIWCFKEPEEKNEIEDLKKAKIVRYNSKAYYEAYSKAKYFISNSRIPEAIKPRDGQEYIQTWHGTPLKRLGYDLQNEGGNALNSLKDMRKKCRKI